MKLFDILPPISLAFFLMPSGAQAQLTPDNSLGAESSVVTPHNPTTDHITGGAARGSNLFHSFGEFNVDAGRSVYFANPLAIENILTRVTGGNPSNIFGTLGVLGDANLFLVNPAGIVFGPGARLDISGSFFATTAEGIKLGPGDVFSATNPDGSPLLTVKPEALFDNAMANYMARLSQQGNLAVGTGSTLGLHGGEVNVTGRIGAPGGRVEVLGDRVTVGERARIDVSSMTGNGGFVEVSGNRLSFAGTVDTRGTNGTGTLLLDPKNIEISTSGTMSGETISQNLNRTDVVLQAENDITVDDDITGTQGNSLTLQAGRSITIGEKRTIALGGGEFVAYINDENAIASSRVPGVAQFRLEFESQLLTAGGNVLVEPGTLGADAIGQVIIDKGTINAGGGNITLKGRVGDREGNGYGIYMHNGSVVETTGSGKIELTGNGNNGNRGIYIVEQSRLGTEDGDISLNGTGGNSNAIEIQSVEVSAQGSGNITLTGVADNGRGIRSGSSIISAVDGDLALIGSVNDGGGSGIELDRMTVEARGEGNITLIGTGGREGGANDGISSGRTSIISQNGDISITGTTGGSQENDSQRGIKIDFDNQIVSEGNGNITLTGISNGDSLRGNGIAITRRNRLETRGTGNISLWGMGSPSAAADIVIETSDIIKGGDSELLSLEANRINLDNVEIMGSSLLQLQATEATADLSLNLNRGSLGGTQSNSQVRIGSPESSGKITITGNGQVNAPMTVLSPLGNGSISSREVTLVGSQNATISFQAREDITLAGSQFYLPEGTVDIASINGRVDRTDTTVFDKNTVVGGEIVPDDSLGGESSVVVATSDNRTNIEGGATRGSNLLHSFSQFNIGRGQRVYFVNGDGISNILTRVTGNNQSEIWGTLGVEGEANLFLLNPNGTVFGPSATLDINSSLVTTSAGAIGLANGEIFSRDPGAQLPSQLLNVNPQKLLFPGVPSGQITNQGNLEVPEGRSIILVGGDVTLGGEFLDRFALGSELSAPGGRIELAGLTAAGEIGIFPEGDQWRLEVPLGITRGDISLLNGARVNVASGGGGDIVLTGKEVEIAGADIGDNPSILRGGIEEASSGSPSAVAGDITIKATGGLRFADLGQIENNLRGTGTGGNINISAESLSFNTRRPLRGVIKNEVLSEGVGDAGAINIKVRDMSMTTATVISGASLGEGDAASVSIEATETFEINGSGISTIAEVRGNAGDITIKANRIVGGRGGPFMQASNLGEGNSGRVSLLASEEIDFGGFMRSEIAGVGESSSIDLQARSIVFEGRVESETGGPSRGSDINITAEELVIKSGRLRTSSLGPEASGSGGDINIVADRVELGDERGGLLLASGTEDRSSGKGGNISITARELTVNQGTRLNTGVLSDATGTGGTIKLEVGEVLSLSGSEIRGDVESQGRGDGGSIEISAGELVLRDGAVVQGSTQGKGNAGTITVNAGVVDIGGSDPETGLPSGLFTSSNTEFDAGDITVNSNVFQIGEGAVLSARSRGDGSGGTIAVNTSEFRASSGGQLVTTTFGDGVAGNIEVNASGEVSLSGSDPSYSQRIADFAELDNADIVNDISETGAQTGLYASSTQSSTQGGGTIALSAESLRVSDRARIRADSDGTGSGGNIFINANQLQLENGGNINADTASGLGGGNITLTGLDLRVEQNSSIETNARGQGNGGDITINTDTLVVLEASSITANAVGGRGGNIAITTSGLFSSPDSSITASSQFGVSGIVTVNNPDSNPTAGLVSLPKNPIDPNEQIATGCAAFAEGNSFTVVGRGGLPEDPTSTIRGTTLWQDTTNYLEQTVPSEGRSGQKPEIELHEEPPIVQVTGWVKHPDGRIELVASLPGGGLIGANCRQLRPPHNK